MSLDLGRVVGVHPEDNSVDIVLVSNGSRIAGVQVLSGSASSISGLTDIQEPAAGGEYWDNTQARAHDTFAAVGFFGGRPVVVGFLFPQVSEVLFKRKNFRVDRHASDWYQTVDDAGNVEWAHPSGSFLRIAENPEHEVLDGQDFDGKWALKRNLERAPWLSFMLQNSTRQEVMRLRVSPDGDVILAHDRDLLTSTGRNASVQITGNAQVTVGGNATVAVAGTTAVSSGGPLSLTAPAVTITGATTIVGATSIVGSLTNNGVNVGSSHTHGGITGGPSRTAVPG